MTLDEIRDLYAYGAWANARTFDAVQAAPAAVADAEVVSSFPSIRATLAHLIGSEWVWRRRGLGESPTAVPAWVSQDDVAALRRQLKAVERERADWLARLTASDLVRVVAYRNLAGTPFAEPLSEQLRHVVNHSSYHRGQVTTLLRQAGQTPRDTDLITFIRERRIPADH